VGKNGEPRECENGKAGGRKYHWKDILCEKRNLGKKKKKVWEKNRVGSRRWGENSWGLLNPKSVPTITTKERKSWVEFASHDKGVLTLPK